MLGPDFQGNLSLNLNFLKHTYEDLDEKRVPCIVIKEFILKRKYSLAHVLWNFEQKTKQNKDILMFSAALIQYHSLFTFTIKFAILVGHDCMIELAVQVTISV